MNSEKKKLYITGVSGFIGSRLAKLCLNRGFKVVGITRSAAIEVRQTLGIEVIEADLNDKSDLVLHPAEAIIHCATANDILSKKLSDGLSLSILGTSKILEASKNAKISNIIFFSTAQVYGTELKGYYDEGTTVDCKSSYAINHYLGEELCKFYCKAHDFNIIALRPSNVYGVPEINSVNRKTLVPMCFVDEAIKQSSITLRSSGKQTRNFISIDELAETVFETIDNFPKGFSLRNCGSNYYPSMLEIVDIVSKQYLKIYKRKLDINIESDQPSIANIFQYNSKFGKYRENKKNCINNLENIINDLFKLWSKK